MWYTHRSVGTLNQAWANPGKSLQPTYKCGYSHIRKSENTDFYQYPQMFGGIFFEKQEALELFTDIWSGCQMLTIRAIA